jgi:hypothetical protein
MLFIQGVYVDPGSKPDQKICSTERQVKIRGKNKVKIRTSSKRISFVCSVIWYIVRVWTSRLRVLSL